METLLYLNVCIREAESRTKQIAAPVLEALRKRYEVQTIDLTHLTMPPINYQRHLGRMAGTVDPQALSWAKQVAAADRIVIAAPFWDMSFPAILKIFCENVSLFGVTFGEHPDHTARGLCRAKKLMLITTRGFDIEDGSPLDQGSSYLKALGWLWGIPEVVTVSARGLDLCSPEEIAKRVEAAKEKALALAESF